jgi:hypothetical protein
MDIQMRHVGVLRLLFALVSLVDQKIETIGVNVSGQNASELLFVQSHELLNGISERLEKLTGDIAVWQRAGCDPKKLRLRVVRIQPVPPPLCVQARSIPVGSPFRLFNGIATNIYFRLKSLAPANGKFAPSP